MLKNKKNRKEVIVVILLLTTLLFFGAVYSYLIVDRTKPNLILPASTEECYNPEKPQKDWWNPQFMYRQQFSIINLNNTTTLPKGYPVLLSIGITELVSQGKALCSGNDIRIVYLSTYPKELERIVILKPIATYPAPEDNYDYEPAESGEHILTISASSDTQQQTNALKLTFYIELQESILPNSAANNYYMYYGNMLADEPPIKVYEYTADFTPPPVVQLGVITDTDLSDQSVVPASTDFTMLAIACIIMLVIVRFKKINSTTQKNG